MVREAVMDDDTLIARYVEENSRFPGAADAWPRDGGVPVWALVGYYQQAAAQDLQWVADDYDLPIEAVAAAFAYHGRYRRPIDDRIVVNVA
jgi:hypothetical protein